MLIIMVRNTNNNNNNTISIKLSIILLILFLDFISSYKMFMYPQITELLMKIIILINFFTILCKYFQVESSTSLKHVIHFSNFAAS